MASIQSPRHVNAVTSTLLTPCAATPGHQSSKTHARHPNVAPPSLATTTPLIEPNLAPCPKTPNVPKCEGPCSFRPKPYKSWPLATFSESFEDVPRELLKVLCHHPHTVPPTNLNVTWELVDPRNQYHIISKDTLDKLKIEVSVDLTGSQRWKLAPIYFSSQNSMWKQDWSILERKHGLGLLAIAPLKYRTLIMEKACRDGADVTLVTPWLRGDLGVDHPLVSWRGFIRGEELAWNIPCEAIASLVRNGSSKGGSFTFQSMEASLHKELRPQWQDLKKAIPTQMLSLLFPIMACVIRLVANPTQSPC
mmetsp:Transcript_8033/g.14924  ORF Transcript_8033/g.14924 Transcript_8033/m.14924 type:complete len:307 (-) Transcript_8033:1967-2887(-)